MTRVAMLMVTVLAATACPGSAGPRRDRAKDGYLGPLPDGPRPGDKGPREAGATDLPASLVDQQQNNVVGGPCPCAPPLLCALAACRQPCPQVPCNGVTSCDPMQACLNTVIGTSVCVPAVAVGAECTNQLPCASGSKCLTTLRGSTKGNCFPSCTVAGQACATGGTCTKVADPSAGSCLVCH